MKNKIFCYFSKESIITLISYKINIPTRPYPTDRVKPDDQAFLRKSYINENVINKSYIYNDIYIYMKINL